MRAIYLDNQATTQMDPLVIEETYKMFKEEFGNPHSRSHEYGWNSERIVENARAEIAKLINAQSEEIIFTSGATESNNLALKGLAEFYGSDKNHIITLKTEHKCIIETCRYLESQDYNITFLSPDKDGIIDPETIANVITDKTLAVSIMALHNEIGVIQDIERIGKICRDKNVFFHTDAAQAFGKIPLDVEKMNIDLLSISSHKIYGPKGIGALYVRKKSPRVKLKPIIHGGGQERGMRSGTLPTPIIHGFGIAAKIAYQQMDTDYNHAKSLSEYFIAEITKIPHVYLNGSREKRYPGNINFSFAYIEGESLLMALKGIAVSSGSACTSASLEPSYVLKALGLKDELAHSSIRFGIGRFTSKNEIDYTIEILKQAVQKLRNLSPLWEMVQDGIDLDTIKWNEV